MFEPLLKYIDQHGDSTLRENAQFSRRIIASGLSQSDIYVKYPPQVPSASNVALLSREKLDLIRPESAFILLSRSHVVDFDALTEMLLAGRFLAGIDVFPQEPLPKDHPIRGANHAVLSSHRAGANHEAIQNIGRIVADDVEAICSDRIPQVMQQAQPEYIRLRG